MTSLGGPVVGAELVDVVELTTVVLVAPGVVLVAPRVVVVPRGSADEQAATRDVTAMTATERRSGLTPSMMSVSEGNPKSHWTLCAMTRS